MKDGSTTAQFALLLHGRIGRLNRTASDAVRENLGASRQLIALCSSSHLHFVVAANSGPAGGVDIFVHTWNPESAAFIDASYGAHLRASEHQPVEVQNNGRSQSLSIGRAALLMRAHERQRGRAYTLALALRADVTLGSPFLLAAMEPSHIWLPSLCGFWKRIHATAQSSRFEEGIVRRSCGSTLAASTPSVHMARHRIDQLWGLRNANFSSAINLASFTNDFWVAAGPSVLATWIDISEHFASYQFWLLKIAGFSTRPTNREKWMMRDLITVAHFLWPIHIHHMLKMSGKVRFSRVLAVIGRHAADYLVRPRSRSQLEHWKPKNWALNTLSCDTLHVRRAGCSFKSDVTSARCEDRWVSATAEMNRMRAVPWQSVLDGTHGFEEGSRWLGAWMQQCPFAREPVVCCGTNVPCWQTVCSREETANFELMRGFALAAKNTSEVW